MSRNRSMVRMWGPWAALLVVVAVAVGIGLSRRPAAMTLSQRTTAIASEIRCPSCEDLNSAESNSQAAVAVRSLIRTDLIQGQSKAQIESYLVARYGQDIILKPATHGLTALVWFIPATAAVFGLGGALFALRRWRGTDEGAGPDEADRALVSAALAGSEAGDAGAEDADD